MGFNLREAIQSRHLLAPRGVFSKTPLSRLRGLDVLALDVGARGGFDFLLAPIAPLVTFIGFDPDAAEIERLEAAGAQGWGGVRYLPVALGETADARPLYLTRSPGCSSLLESDPEVYGRYGREALFAVEGTTEVATLGLDEAAREYGFEAAAYLKLDIQGAELEVLRTGTRLLEESVTAIRAEVEFQPIYRDQPLFRDVDVFLSEQGFMLTGLHHPISWSLQPAGQAPFASGRDCLGDLIHADAFYLRYPDRYSDEDDAGIALCVRGALVALALGRLSYAATLLGRPRVAAWLADGQGIDAAEALEKARRLMRRHTRRARWLELARAVLRG